uniref:Uncharacterized protein n=1 Tax=Oryza meridionalis TaxID=40149 RepID=A0A0E0CL05_9ORYZ
MISMLKNRTYQMRIGAQTTMSIILMDVLKDVGDQQNWQMLKIFQLELRLLSNWTVSMHLAHNLLQFLDPI